jgi:two-component system cell cycle response regulator
MMVGRTTGTDLPSEARMSGHSLFGAAEVRGSSLMQALVIDDSAVYRKLIGDHLRSWGFGVRLAETGSAAWEMLQQADAPKLALLDWVLPDLDGIELCRRIREAGSSGSYVYVILLTSKEGRQNMLEAMQAGADDYLVKPFDEMELKARLLVGKRILDLQEALVSARESMRHAATHDHLTGLLNRGEIVGMLECELERSRRDRKPVGVILGDIDNFKSVNDSLGHLFGDEALREIGRRLQQQLRIYDGVGRYGGEEFLLVLPNCEATATMQRANDLREFIANMPVVCAGATRTVTMSMGVAVSDGDGKSAVEGLLNLADAGLYQAKQSGRNRVVHFTARAKKAAAGRAHKG